MIHSFPCFVSPLSRKLAALAISLDKFDFVIFSRVLNENEYFKFMFIEMLMNFSSFFLMSRRSSWREDGEFFWINLFRYPACLLEDIKSFSPSLSFPLSFSISPSQALPPAPSLPPKSLLQFKRKFSGEIECHL